MDRDALVVGESLIDIVRGSDGSTVEYAGGSAANVAVALARLGRAVRFASSWADDDRGRLLARHVADTVARMTAGGYRHSGVDPEADPALRSIPPALFLDSVERAVSYLVNTGRVTPGYPEIRAFLEETNGLFARRGMLTVANLLLVVEDLDIG